VRSACAAWQAPRRAGRARAAAEAEGGGAAAKLCMLYAAITIMEHTVMNVSMYVYLMMPMVACRVPG
jgi:hypothetical protein